METNVLLSIKPDFVNKIFNGEKKYEYRKSVFKRSNINKIIIYATSPVKKVVGEFTIGKILKSDKDLIWKNTFEKSGITKQFFDEYFYKHTIAYAIEIEKFKQYSEPKCLKEDFNISYAPQSFRYLN